MDPIRNFRFILDVDGLGVAEFTDASGVNATTDVIEYRTGQDKTLKKYPGLTKYGNITLKTGTTENMELFNWFQMVVDGEFGSATELEKKSGTIFATDYATGEPIAEWEFQQAWPVKYTAPDFTAKGNDIAVESLELACESIIRKK